jgi:ParB family chromosome partitioning protein
MTAIKAVKATAGINVLNVSEIKTNKYNPRKSFPENELQELAESIKQLGVLQPILVRPKGKKYEIIFGERRYKAVVLAGLTEIPANVRELSDDDAMDMAITENLQRQDISPIEEANAFQSLVGSKRYDVMSLVMKFGKSDTYIRGRLKLNDLVTDFKDMLLSDGVNISIALELVKYSQEIQQDIYNRHFTDDNYSSWRGLNVSKLAKNIENGYTTNLERYFFDKTACLGCPFNSSNFSLFGAENPEGKCSKNDCLHQKNVEYLTVQADSLIEKNPSLSLCTNAYSCSSPDTDTVVEKLKEKGHQLIGLEHKTRFPKEPSMPQADDYEVPEMYSEAVTEYDDDLLAYNAQMREITDLEKQGEVNVYACIGTQEIELYYVENDKNGDGKQVVPMAVTLQNKDKRNKEISVEKTLEDTKKLMQDKDLSQGDFSILEDKLMYFVMLSDLQHENFHYFGMDNNKACYLKDEDKITIINALTEEQKTIIRRDYIQVHLSKSAYGLSGTTSMFFAFTMQHANEEFMAIKDKHTETYQKRHDRLEERIALLQNQQEVA